MTRFAALASSSLWRPAHLLLPGRRPKLAAQALKLDSGIADHAKTYQPLLSVRMHFLHSDLVGLVAKAAATGGHG